MTGRNDSTPRRDRTPDPMQDLRPTIWIGKQGCTETIVREVIAQLEKRKIIKVKWLQNTEIDPRELADRAGAELVGVRGRTIVLAERRKR